MLKETITIEIVLIITGAFKIFETVQQLTNGGPSHTSEVLVTYMYFTTLLQIDMVMVWQLQRFLSCFLLCVPFFI